MHAIIFMDIYTYVDICTYIGIYTHVYIYICNVDEMRHACDVDQERHHKRYTMYIRRRDMHCRSEEKSQEMCNVDQERLLD